MLVECGYVVLFSIVHTCLRGHGLLSMKANMMLLVLLLLLLLVLLLFFPLLLLGLKEGCWGSGFGGGRWVVGVEEFDLEGADAGWGEGKCAHHWQFVD